MDFGGRFKALREVQGLTMREVARRAGMQEASGASQLSRIEEGATSPTWRTVEVLVTRGLRVTLAHFFGGGDEVTQAKALADLLGGLTPDDRREVLDFALYRRSRREHAEADAVVRSFRRAHEGDEPPLAAAVAFG